MSESYLIAIDFGTSYSGYAYNITPRGAELDPKLRRWGAEYGHDTPKTPTCILFDGNGNFMHFGYKAKDKFLEMDKDDVENNYFFENFKMELYNKKITKDLTIKDARKRPMSALKVFSAALRFLKDDALKTISLNTHEMKFTAADFRWVLTVPAIWDNSARQFMRDAAVEAGIMSLSSPDKLVIALEPEAASVWCKTLPSDGFITEQHEGAALQQTPGTQYIVVDCGGGTIDITVHEVLEGGALKELHRASGNDKGGQRVNKRFNQCLREFFCGGLWEDYEKEFPNEAQKFMYDFEIVKGSEGDVKMNCYYNIADLINQNQNMGKKVFNSVEGVSWAGGKILISKSKMESFFRESLVHIVDSLSEILDSHSQIQYILLVGGFSQSRILCNHVHQQFSDQVRVLCPKNPQEAILRGALAFGRDPAVIRSRKSTFTYGVESSVRYDESKHKSKFTNKEGDWCTVMFYKLVGIGEDVGWDETKEYTFSPIDRDQTQMNLNFYRTERKSVTYVDEWGVEGPVACCEVPMPDTSKGMKRSVKLEVFFGSTEIRAKATDLESNCTASVKVDFISK